MEEWYFTVGSPPPERDGSQPPTYATHPGPASSAKLQ